jgi:diguanylate cyclase (GGDEF)-like protein/PAS domain S-box-containing protein
MADDNIYRDLLDNLVDGVYFTDRERRINYWNKGAERLSGFRREDVLGKRCMDNILMHMDEKGNELCRRGCPLAYTIKDGIVREADLFLHHRGGHRVPVRVRVSPLTDEKGRIVGAVEVFSDNSAKAQLTERLAQMEQLALLDSLTGLANRRYLESHIRARLEELRRNGWSFGVLFMDIDRFKNVNDTFGHEVGDRVLRMVGQTLDASTRYFDMVGRWGGEEFLAVIANTEAQTLSEIGERFRALVERSALMDPDRVHVTISTGGTHARAEDTVEALVARADEKLYEAKNSGRNRVWIGI